MQKSEADALGVDYLSLDIEPIYEAFIGRLEQVFGDRPIDETEQNIQARSRGVFVDGALK